MPDIEFECEHCRQVLEAPDDMAGETIECPACGRQIVVPILDDVEIEDEESATSLPVCPSCGGEMQPDAVLCVQCGYHLKLRRKIQTDIR